MDITWAGLYRSRTDNPLGWQLDRYGYEVSGKDDRYVAIAEEALGLLSGAFLPGAYLVNLIKVSEINPGGLRHTHEMRSALSVAPLSKAYNSLTQFFASETRTWMDAWGRLPEMAARARKLNDELQNEPFQFVKREMVKDHQIDIANAPD
jgi:hypothetical protein